MTLFELLREIEELISDGYGDCLVRNLSGEDVLQIDPKNSEDDLWIEVVF